MSWLEVKNIYKSFGKTEVLKGIDFSLEKGEGVALIGSSGSGKTTILSLITRNYDIQKGQILIDGINIKKYSLESLRNNIGIVLQDPFLYNKNIFDNVKISAPNKTKEEVYNATMMAHVHNDILNFDKKYETLVGEKGVTLSGGQKQRLSIARAIVKKPEILIFDDASSALDLVTEAKLYKAMRSYINDTTRIVVAQRVATARNADKIMVLDGGVIVDFDTHENLLKNCDVYQDIYNSQLKKEGDE